MPRPIEAAGFAELVTALEGYRIANGIPVGDPKGDILAYIAKKTYRSNIPDAHQPQPSTEPKTLRDRVTQWLSDRFMGAQSRSLQLVDEQEAQRRADICVSCPRNQTWKVGCPPCISNNERVVLLLTQGKQVSNSSLLLGCESCGHDNESAVWLQRELLGQVGEDAPTYCWMRDK
jgi:hypothetical protein